MVVDCVYFSLYFSQFQSFTNKKNDIFKTAPTSIGEKKKTLINLTTDRSCWRVRDMSVSDVVGLNDWANPSHWAAAETHKAKVVY